MIWQKFKNHRRWLLGEFPSAGYMSLHIMQKWLDEKRLQRPLRYRIFIALSSVHNRFRLIKKRFREKWIVKSHLQHMEEFYQLEDNEMLEKLFRIRGDLWA